MRRIGTERQVQTHRTDRSAVANAESNSVHHVVEAENVLLRGYSLRSHQLRGVRLVPAEGNILQPAVNVAGIPEQDAAEAVAEKWEAQLRVEEQQSLPAHRKSGGRIARAGLILRKSGMGVAAAGEKTLGNRNILESHAGE